LSMQTIKAQAPSWAWAKNAGDSLQDIGYSVATDASGNVFITGGFTSDSITFGTTTLIRTGTFGGNLFVVKYSPAGNVLWAKSAGLAAGDDQAYGICTDASGNVFITGYFTGSPLIIGNDTLTNAGGLDIFVAKYDASGNAIWAKSAGGTSDENGNGIATDANGNVFITGFFDSFTITFGSTTLTNMNNTSALPDIFVAKYDPSGNVLWAKSAGSLQADFASGISVDKHGNVLITGTFNSNATFGTFVLNGTGDEDFFVAKYDNSGNFKWAKMAGTVGNFYTQGYGVATDTSDNIVATGYYQGTTIEFDTITLTNAGGNNGYANIFVVKYDTSGNVIWAKSAGGISEDEGLTIATDANNNVFVSGYFTSSPITFGTYTFTNAGWEDIYVVKYTSSGAIAWAKNVGGTGYDQCNGITVDHSGNVLVTGYSNSPTLSFGSTTLTNEGPSGTKDVFVAKLNGSTGIEEISQSNNGLVVYPNPATTLLHIHPSIPSPNQQLIITDLLGTEVYKEMLTGIDNTISISTWSAGIYFYEVRSDTDIARGKFMKEN
jgi:hypothetical protein